ncbi:MAG: ATP-binding protein [Chromatiales bacterium]|nr:ATP-binding protein [Chromatiales bacterium]
MTKSPGTRFPRARRFRCAVAVWGAVRRHRHALPGSDRLSTRHLPSRGSVGSHRQRHQSGPGPRIQAGGGTASRRAHGGHVRARDQARDHAPRVGGTLPISRQLVERMGGEIGVESRVGEGSTFWFNVALAR